MKSCYIDVEHRAIADLFEVTPYDVHDTMHTPPGKCMLLTRINVPRMHRGNGVARRLMQQVLRDADAERVTIYLHISPSDGLDFEQLEAWYERCGFVCAGIHYRRDPR